MIPELEFGLRTINEPGPAVRHWLTVSCPGIDSDRKASQNESVIAHPMQPLTGASQLCSRQRLLSAMFMRYEESRANAGGGPWTSAPTYSLSAMPTVKRVEIISLTHLILKLPCMTDESQILCLFGMLYFNYKHIRYL